MVRQVKVERDPFASAGGSGDKVTDLAAASGEVAGSNYLMWTMARFAAVGLYHFTDRIFSLFGKNT